MRAAPGAEESGAREEGEREVDLARGRMKGQGLGLGLGQPGCLVTPPEQNLS